MLAGFLIGCFVGCLLGVLVTCLMAAGKWNSAYIISPEKSGVAKRGNAQLEGLGGEQGLVFPESKKAAGAMLTSHLRDSWRNNPESSMLPLGRLEQIC